MQVLGGSSGEGVAGDSSGAGVNALAISSSTEGTSTDHNLSNGISQANSAISIDYPEQVASTIGKFFCYHFYIYFCYFIYHKFLIFK